MISLIRVVEKEIQRYSWRYSIID